MVKKIYNQPACLVVELGSRNMFMGVSATNTGLDGTSFVEGGTSTNNISDADVKGVTDVNLWDSEW